MFRERKGADSMKKTPVLDFLLGALSPSGFSGWFAEAAAEPGAKPRLIKAGPGCGKSTFMRKSGRPQPQKHRPVP